MLLSPRRASALVPGSAKVPPIAKASALPNEILQPGKGPIHGQHYLHSLPDQVRWGYVPALGAAPVLRMRSEETVTVDSISHEGLLEDQGRDPIAFFGSHGVPADQVLSDAIAVARHYTRTRRSFDVDGPHVVTGPVYVEGARPGDVLKIEVLSLLLRVPYGVVSNRHGLGALARKPGGGPPAGITLNEVMPPVSTDGRATRNPLDYGDVFEFTPVRRGRDGGPVGVLPVGTSGQAAFPLHPHMGMMGVAFASVDALTAPQLNSIPPTLGAGNIDIRLLGEGATFYVPVFSEGALFYTGDSHMAMGNGEVALTAMEGSLRTTFRLTVCKKGSGDAPSVAFYYPFAETPQAWVAVGLSDPDGSQHGQCQTLRHPDRLLPLPQGRQRPPGVGRRAGRPGRLHHPGGRLGTSGSSVVTGSPRCPGPAPGLGGAVPPRRRGCALGGGQRPPAVQTPGSPRPMIPTPATRPVETSGTGEFLRAGSTPLLGDDGQKVDPCRRRNDRRRGQPLAHRALPVRLFGQDIHEHFR